MSKEGLLAASARTLDASESFSLAIVAILKLRRVVHDEKLAFGLAAVARGFHVGLQDQFRCHPVIGEEASRAFTTSAVERTREPAMSVNRQFLDQASQPQVQPFVFKIPVSNLERQLPNRDGLHHSSPSITSMALLQVRTRASAILFCGANFPLSPR